MVSVGIPARPPVARRPLVEMAEYSINAKTTGIIRNFDFLTQWQNHPDVLYARPLVPVSFHRFLCVTCVMWGFPPVLIVRRLQRKKNAQQPVTQCARTDRAAPNTQTTRRPAARWCVSRTACPPGCASSWSSSRLCRRRSTLSSRLRSPWTSSSTRCPTKAEWRRR